MQESAFGSLGVDQCPLDPVAEFCLAPGQCADPAFAGRPVARRHVEQRLDEPVAVQLPGDRFGRMVVRGEILDRLEAGGGRCGEAVEKRDFLEYEAQIGGKFWHGRGSVASVNNDRYSSAADGSTQYLRGDRYRR
jgi:hypothetical protein